MANEMTLWIVIWFLCGAIAVAIDWVIMWRTGEDILLRHLLISLAVIWAGAFALLYSLIYFFVAWAANYVSCDTVVLRARKNKAANKSNNEGHWV